MHSDETILVTGGAGFIGAQLALELKERHTGKRVVALDNLKRRGSELNLKRLKEGGVEFLHGDVREMADLPEIVNLSLIIECSAEPSVLAGFGESPRYVIASNLTGAINCLELARKTSAAMIFLSTSRVYPLRPLCGIKLKEGETRFTVLPEQTLPGVSEAGISEAFPLEGARSLYGATKYAAEVFINEYAQMYGLRAIVNRCGVIAGPWQMGRIDQGIMALWISRHLFGGALSYIGFGGKGLQVRDMLHVRDLLDLVVYQANEIDKLKGHTFNVGGGVTNSASLYELTGLCRHVTGNSIEIRSAPEERPADIPYYVTDNTAVRQACGWSPRYSLETIVSDTVRWMRDNQEALRSILE
ncbi:MAG TPA: NAD-dependent epimerase/dehydratase family protein [Candidatus Hydrogenedentes bacterium]|nr:NAD-dependent epimerase/dehydratase family protein [Candidatus Hydrogenedentota bacterium]